MFAVCDNYYEEIEMPHKLNFDTLKYANKLMSVGVPKKQAEMQANLQVEILSETLDEHIATKNDIKLVKDDIKLVKDNIKLLDKKIDQKIDQVNLRIDKIDLKVDKVAYRTVIILGGMIATSCTILGFLIKLQ